MATDSHNRWQQMAGTIPRGKPLQLPASQTSIQKLHYRMTVQGHRQICDWESYCDATVRSAMLFFREVEGSLLVCKVSSFLCDLFLCKYHVVTWRHAANNMKRPIYVQIWFYGSIKMVHLLIKCIFVKIWWCGQAMDTRRRKDVDFHRYLFIC